LDIGPVFWPRRSPATGVAREMLVILRVSNNRQGLSPSMVWPQPLATFGLGTIASVPEFPCPGKQPKAMLT
jgi:hypothetical protein